MSWTSLKWSQTDDWSVPAAPPVMLFWDLVTGDRTSAEVTCLFFFSQNKRIDGRILHVGRTVISCTFFAFWVSSICKANVGKMREISVCCPQSYLSPVDLSSAHSCVKMSHMHKQSAKPHSQPHIRKFVAFPHELQTFAYLLFYLHTHWNAMPKLNQTCTCIFILFYKKNKNRLTLTIVITSLWVTLVSYRNKINLTILESPRSYEVGKFHNWINDMIKLQHRLRDSWWKCHPVQGFPLSLYVRLLTFFQVKYGDPCVWHWRVYSRVASFSWWHQPTLAS